MKKLFCTFVALITLCSSFAVNVYATTKTRDEAINWAKSQVGHSLDYDGNGAWCVDLIAGYYQFLGTSTPGGNAYAYASNALPSGWQRLSYYTTFIPQPGDIAVWTYSSGSYASYGHVGIVISADSNSFTVVDQCGSQMYVCAYTSYGYYKMRPNCFIRPNFAAASVPAPQVSNNTSGAPTNGATYIINSIENGKPLNCYAWSIGDVVNYTKINTYDRYEGDLCQRFTLEANGSAYNIKTQANGYLVNIMSRYNAGAQAIAYSRYSDIEPWLIKPCGSGYALILNSNQGMALTVGTDGNVTLQPYTGSRNQQWTFEKV